VSVAAATLVSSFDELRAVSMRVGALPQFPTNGLKYNLAWLTDGLINEYRNPCEAITDGERREVPPLEELEAFSLDGVVYEAFNTSGGWARWAKASSVGSRPSTTRPCATPVTARS
jgi:saccharopine dehydrogenase-like NADP-dependent oxidoreductase